jgi:hypothetical protein
VGPAGAQRFEGRHRAALAGPHDAFDERAFAEEAHDDAGQGDHEDHRDEGHRDLRREEAQHAAEGGRPVSATLAARPATAVRSAAGDADDEPEQPERPARAGVVEGLSDDLAYGHARLPVDSQFWA